MSEIVKFTKSDGPLTKRICLDDKGAVKSDGSACVMSRGVAYRTPVACVGTLGELIGGMRSDQAIALGALRHGLPDEVAIATKKKAIGAIIARTTDNITFRSQPGFVLLDFDSKGMPPDVAERLQQDGGFWKALRAVTPELGTIGRLRRASTSAGLYDRTTGTAVPGSNGVHVYLSVTDVSDSGRFLRTLHERCWIAGYGWMMVGRGGQLLERSIIDRMVGSPERLVFEGAPILVEPLAQKVEARRPQIREGGTLDTRAACVPLGVLDRARLEDLRNKAGHRLSGDAARARDVFVEEQADKLAKRSGVSMRAAREAVHKQCEGILLPGIALPFDDPELEGKTVADVLADPVAFEGETLADPLEGIDYSRCKAKIMRRADGTPWINSFAHGRTTYELKLDAKAIRAAMDGAPTDEVLSVLTDMLQQSDVKPAEQDDLIAHAGKRTGIGVNTVKRQIRIAAKAQARESAKQAQAQRMAERTDTRPMLETPAGDAPWRPMMGALGEVYGISKRCVPLGRTIETDAVAAFRVDIGNLRGFSKQEIET
jgi:hypothetical protein